MNAVKVALYARLSGDSGTGGVAALATGGIYDLQGKQDASLPFVTFQKWTPLPTRWTFGVKVSDDALYLIKAYAADAKTAGQITERAESILNDYALSVSGKTLMYLRKDSDMPEQPPQVWNGVPAYSTGIIMKLMVS
jgi:hypothetical protein